MGIQMDLFPNKSKKFNSIRSLRAVYCFALVCVAVSTMASHGLLRSVESLLIGDTSVINTAGRQRTLGQRISLLSRQWYDEARTGRTNAANLTRQQVTDTIATWQSNYRSLLSPDGSMPDADRPEGIESALRQIDRFHSGLSEKTVRLFALQNGSGTIADSPEADGLVDEIAAEAEAYLPAMDAIVSMFEAESRARVAQLARLETITTLVTLLLLAGLAGLVFEPTIRRMSRQENALQKAHRDLQDVLDAASHVSIIATDCDGLITTFNKGAENLLGYRASEMVGLQTPALIHLESEVIERGAALSELVGKSISGFEVFVWHARNGGHDEREWTYIRKDGSHFPVNLTVTAVRNTNGRIAGFLGVARDLSSQKSAERKLAAQRIEQQAIIDAIPGVVFYKDDQNIVLDCNERAARLLGMPREQIRGKSTEVLFPANEAQNFGERDAEVLRTGRPALGIVEKFDVPDRAPVHMRLDTIPLRGPDGRFNRIVAIATDISKVVNANDQIRIAERRLDLAMRASGTGLWDWSVPTGETYFNDVVFSTLGYARDELEPTIDTWKDLCHPDDLSACSLALAEHIDGLNETYSCEYRIRKKDGEYVWIHDVGQVVERDQNGFPQRIIGVYINIQSLRSAVEEVESANSELQRTQQRFELAIEGSRDAIFDWDLSRQQIYFSPMWQDLLKVEYGTLGGTLFDIERFVAPADISRFGHEIRNFIENGDDRFDNEYQFITSEGDCVWGMMRAVAARDDSGRAVRISGSVADITTLKEAQTEMERLVKQDHLTGLANRHLLSERLEHALVRSQRNGSCCGVLFFDFDRFKVVNDSLGHDVGDQLLCRIADRLTASIRSVDTAARFGGDEFVVLLEDLPEPSGARAVADKLLQEFEIPHAIEGHSIVSTASIGLVTSSQGSDSASDLLRFADAAMYEAKKRGRCCVVEFDKAMYEAQLESAALEEDLGSAIENGELALHYQPVIDLESGQIVSAEALLRWSHPRRGFVPPDVFIGIAEESRQIVGIGDWVIGEACRQLVDWRSRGVVSDDFAISVNASKVQLLTPGFEEDLIRHVDSAGLPRRSIKIEVTETTVVDNRSDIGDTLRSLRENSFIIMMDDFGTGHSSLSVLHNLPIDELKIDQSFIRNADGNKDLVAITSSILTLADHLELRTIGEGIESAHHIALLQTLGCTYGQGYFWSAPVSASEFEVLLRKLDTRAERTVSGMSL